MASCWLKAPHTDHRPPASVNHSDGNWSYIFLKFQCKSSKYKTSYDESVIGHDLNDRSFFLILKFAFFIQFNKNCSSAIYAYCHQKGFSLKVVIKSSLTQ